MSRILLPVLGAVFLLACSDAAAPAGDTGVIDTGRGDGATLDTGVDTGSTDTRPNDTRQDDAGFLDTGLLDTGRIETAVSDAPPDTPDSSFDARDSGLSDAPADAAADIGVVDTAAADTGLADTGVVIDTAVIDTGPVDLCGGCAEGVCVGTSCVGFGDGSEGEITYGGMFDDANDVRLRLESADAGSTTVNWSRNGFTTAGDVVPGNRIVLHQTVSETGGEGLYEYADVVSVGDTTITVAAPLRHTYRTTTPVTGDEPSLIAQIVKVHEYRSYTVGAGARLRLLMFNGTTVGGVAAIDVAGDLVIEGSIDATQSGYGALSLGAPCSLLACQQGGTGPSYLGYNMASVFPNGSGGGGGQPGSDCAGGGGGGHAQAGGAGIDGSCTGGCGEACPQLGGRGGNPSTDTDPTARVLLGSAGGQGGLDEDGSQAGFGGAGGGVLLLRAHRIIVRGAGSINASGSNGMNGNNAPVVFPFAPRCASSGGSGMGGGGGGAGGTILLSGRSSIELGADAVRATGGTGGTCGGLPDLVSGGPGSEGRIWIDAPSITGTSSPAAVAIPAG